MSTKFKTIPRKKKQAVIQETEMGTFEKNAGTKDQAAICR